MITVDPADTDIVWNASSSRWEVSFDVTGFSGFFVKTLAGVLPVQLINFTAAKQNNKVLVTWQTNNEINLNHYEVEGSIDGIHFEKLADVAANNISGTNNYSFTDNSPWVSDIRYYRLTCIENDGKFKRSEIVPVSNKKQTTVTVYPNPVTDVFTIQLGDSKLLHTQAKLVDATGKTIQSITIKTLFQNVPVVYLSNGIYILQLADGTAVKIWKN